MSAAEPRAVAVLTRGADGIARLAVSGGAARRLGDAQIHEALNALAAAGPLLLGVDAPLGGDGLRETDRLCGLTAPRRHDPALTDGLSALHEHGLAVWPFDAAEGHALAVELLSAMLAPDFAAAGAAAGADDDAAALMLAEALAGLQEGGALSALAPLPRPAILCEGRAELLRAALPAAVQPPRLKDDCFAMPQGVDWIPVDEALAKLRAGLSPVTGTEFLPPAAALGRPLAAPARAARSNPPAPNSAVDGYGFAHAATGAGVQRLPLVDGRAAAGGPYEAAVPPGMAIRILTGAILPEGVDTVVLEEDCARDGAAVVFDGPVKPRANTRRAGEDVEAGAEALPAGHVLRAPDVALLTALGVDTVAVRRPLRVAVLSTGDELMEAGEADAGPHRIYDANRPMLLALLRGWGCKAVDLGRAPDDESAIAAALDRGATGADVILTSGGASAGDEDHVSRLLRTRGDLQSWRIALKPGRPLALAQWNGAMVFGLPGNPVAALVCALVFARPALSLMGGAGWRAAQGFTVPAAFSKRKKPGRREYLRARLNAEGAAEVFASEGSGRISGLSWAEGLVELPDGAVDVAPGDPVRFLPYAGFGI
ncbi:molybdopterin-binding protein [Rhodovulum sp. DZ06]|uniref:molybdopterin-binding protein n=1 Tax=Rhodovulum sp. DZ06 TaxID=3425126 RepID=UPI003D33FDA1